MDSKYILQNNYRPRDRSAIRARGGSAGPYAAKAPLASFLLDFFNNGGTGITPSRGGAAPTFTRATIATITDQDLVVRQVLSGEVRFGGFRRVRNLLTFTEAFSNAAWVSTIGGTGAAITKTDNFATAPDGTLTAGRLQADRGAGNTLADFSFMRQSEATNSVKNESVWLKSNTGASQVVVLVVSGTTVTVTTAWQRFSVQKTLGATPFDLGAQGTLTAQTIDILVWHPLFEDVIGQSNQNPGEYQSVNVLSTPYQGANVDGVRYFPYLNGNTVASNVVTEANGAAISSSILGGYLPEPAATDLLTARADARDMTTASWVLGATMSRARTQVGADGVANKANLITGGAVAATNIITTTITAAASSRTFSALVKRGTGTGTVRMSQDGFATNTDITALINSSTFTLVQIAQSQLNAQLGFKIDTNGDTLIIDWNQFSAGDLTGLINSRIPDTITTRNVDNLVYATTGWLNAASGTLYAEWFNPNLSATSMIAELSDGTTNNTINIYIGTITTAKADVYVATVNQSALTAVSITGAAVAKAVHMWQTNDFAGYANNTTLGTDVSGTIPTVTQFNVGGRVGGSLVLGHYIRKMAYYPPRLASSVGQSLTV